MASFIYIYSKFTEEFLLLTAAGSFALLAVYCYTWVVKKRRLGAARDQVPAGMVKIYLSQLINEAQFVRTQLFGLAGGAAPNLDQLTTRFLMNPGAETAHAPHPEGETATQTGQIPSDLWERLKALEHQLGEKESMVVNINIEKTKLLEELENVKQDQKTLQKPETSGNQDDLVQKIKGLEERLEEYALFEDDLANLKRLQQENTQLKKRIDEAANFEQKPKAAPALVSAAPPSAAAPNPAASAADVFDSVNESAGLLDPAAVEALLEGTSAVPPTPPAVPEPTLSQELHINPANSLEPPTPIQAAKPAVPNDEFENLVNSVEGSLAKTPQAEAPASLPSEKASLASPEPATASTEKVTLAPTASAETPLAASAPAAAATGSESSGEKSDEELLKEFENLLNS